MNGYTYDKAGNRTKMTISHPDSYQYKYTRFGAEQTVDNVKNHVVRYTYNGNNQLTRTSEILTGEKGYYEAVDAYTYDENGNLTKKTKTGSLDNTVENYTFNALNQMTNYTKEIDGNQAIQASYQYNARGLRSAKTVNGNTTKYYLHGDVVIDESDGDGNLTARNFIAHGVFAHKNEPDLALYFLTNGHGDVTSYVQGYEVKANMDYDAFGVAKQEMTDECPIGYAGQYHDLESDLIYLRARYYSAQTGRFISEDPIRDGLNWYSYCGNDPVNKVDPTGKVGTLLSNGSCSDDVTELQQMLNKQGYDLVVDGVFGPATQAAVEDYQAKNGLAVDGIVGQNTWNSLAKATYNSAFGADDIAKAIAIGAADYVIVNGWIAGMKTVRHNVVTNISLGTAFELNGFSYSPWIAGVQKLAPYTGILGFAMLGYDLWQDYQNNDSTEDRAIAMTITGLSAGAGLLAGIGIAALGLTAGAALVATVAVGVGIAYVAYKAKEYYGVN